MKIYIILILIALFVNFGLLYTWRTRNGNRFGVKEGIAPCALLASVASLAGPVGIIWVFLLICFMRENEW